MYFLILQAGSTQRICDDIFHTLELAMAAAEDLRSKGEAPVIWDQQRKENVRVNTLLIARVQYSADLRWSNLIPV